MVRNFKQFIFLLIVCLAGSMLPECAPGSAAQSSNSQTSTHKKSARKRSKRSSPRLRRMRQAFVASANLKPMARQLLQDRSPAAYAGVESFAQRHAKDDAGALAWLVVGYAHTLDNDYAKAIAPLSRAKPRADELGDYVDYYLAAAYVQTGRSAEAVPILASFEKLYPNSLLIRDGHVVYANALIAEGRAQVAVPLLEKDRQPIRADLELALGRAYAAEGQADKAAVIFQNLFYTMPLSDEGAQSEAELKKLAPAAAISLPGVGMRKSRADLLLKGKRYNDAANEYRTLLSDVDANDRPALLLALGQSLRMSGNTKDAKQVLNSVPDVTPEIQVQRLFNLAEMARASNDEAGFLKIVDQMRQVAPTSSWFDQELFAAGNLFLLKPDYDRAIDFYRELQQRFPNGSHGAYAHWKVAWLTLRQGKNTEAKKEFEQHVEWYPTSGQVPAALYWRARLAEEDNDLVMARAYYEKLSLRFLNFYYGFLARQRLSALQGAVAPGQYALLDRIPLIDSSSKITAEEAPADNLRVQKAHLMENGALVEFAVRELQAAVQEEAEKGNWLTAESARLYQDADRYYAAIQLLKRTVPNYFAVDLPSLPRPYWEALFPRPYWDDLKKFSSDNGLDPYLVASLIRQESEFNPFAVSRANAVGLMQLLPKVGKGVAKQEKLKYFTTQQLFTPAVNLQLGTRYFRSMVDKFGSFEYALAAYNAGSDRVEDWLKLGKYRDPQEFVESIPFTETREYVQAIVRNENVYRQLYGTP